MSLKDQVLARIAELEAQRAAKQTELDELRSTVEARGDGALTADEEARMDAILADLRDGKTKADAAQARLDALDAEERARAEADAAAARILGAAKDTRIGAEPTTYNPNPSSPSFFGDAFRAQEMGDFQARGRLERHMQEMERMGAGTEARDVGTAAFGSLVVPAYLVDEFAEVLRNGRAVANAVRRAPLPSSGMTVVIPRGQTGTAVATQATEGAAVQETDADFDNDLTINVRTFAGQQDVSRQAIERGTAAIDQLVYADLVADYARALDASIIADDGTAGTHKGLLNATGTNAVTYTDTSPTVAEAWPKLADAKRRVGANRKIPGNLWAMTSTRWGWFQAALDSQNRPLIIDDPSQAVNAMGVANAANFGEGQLVGTLMGVPVLLDDNIPSTLGGGTEDAILYLRRQDPILWEEGDGMPRQLRFDEADGGTLEVKLVVYGYSAFTAERHPTAVSKITGTGLAAPTF